MRFLDILILISSIRSIHPIHIHPSFVVVVYYLSHIIQSNFAMGLAAKKNVAFLIDFGLARKYIVGTSDVRPVCLYTFISFASINLCNYISSYVILFIVITFLELQTDCSHAIQPGLEEQPDMPLSIPICQR